MSELPAWFLETDWHLAVLSGHHAWRLHGLTGLVAPSDHLPMLVAADAGDRIDASLNDGWAQLRRRWWDETTSVERTEFGVEVTSTHGRVVVTAETTPFDLPPAPPTFALVDGRHVPVVDRTTALLERLAAIRDRPAVQDVVDVANWWAPPRRGPATEVGGISSLAELTSVRRHRRPLRGLEATIEAARTELWGHGDVVSIRPILSQLSGAMRAARQRDAARH